MSTSQNASADLAQITQPGPLEIQEGGDHYNRLAYQPIEFSMENELDPCAFSILRYLTRYQTKGFPLEDLRKSLHYLDLRQLFRDRGLPSAQPRPEGLRVPMSRFAMQPGITPDARHLLLLFGDYLESPGRGTALRTFIRDAQIAEEHHLQRETDREHARAIAGQSPRPSESSHGQTKNTEDD